MARQIVLASASPRRKELLGRFVKDFMTISAEVDETFFPGKTAEEETVRVASAKALKVSEISPEKSVVIAADTVVVLEGKIYGKPHTAANAVKTLKELRGKTHSVVTGVACIDKENGTRTNFAEKTDVTFLDYSDELIERYVATGEPLDRAGAYAVQGKGCLLVAKTDGDYDNVVGLPVAALVRKLETAGVFLF